MARLGFEAVIQTTNFYTTNCLEQCANIASKTGIISLALKLSKTSFVPITGKGIAYVRPFNSKLPLRHAEVEFENNICLEVTNTSNSTTEIPYGHEIAYFDARSKGLVQINNSKHFPAD